MTTITDEQIEALKTEASNAGDWMQVYICNAALGGDEVARKGCASTIDAAAAMADIDGYDRVID